MGVIVDTHDYLRMPILRWQFRWRQWCRASGTCGLLWSRCNCACSESEGTHDQQQSDNQFSNSGLGFHVALPHVSRDRGDVGREMWLPQCMRPQLMVRVSSKENPEVTHLN
jgi:hypothetical protein